MDGVRSAVVCGWLGLAAGCAGTTVEAAPSVTPQPLILEVWINGLDTNVVATISRRGGLWWASRDDLSDAGVNVNGIEFRNRGLVPLSRLDGIVAEIDNAGQRLLIKARPDCLAPQRIDLRRPSAIVEPASATGFVASYNVTGTVGDVNREAETSGVDAELGAVFFAAPGTVSTTGFSQMLDGTSQFVRLDTTGEFDEPGLLRRWLLGDAISGGLWWGRSVRFGGLQLASDFTLQPGLTTFPLPAFFGQTAVPGSVDVFVNSARVFEGNVSPGPFEINDLPTVTGSGQATVVVRNVLGEETTQTLSFYASDSLLRDGLSSYDLDAGFLRELYGEESFDYREPLATGTYRYGLSNWFTAEGHFEGASDVQVVGGGGAFSVGALGVVQADAAASNSRAGQGALYSATFESQSQPFGIFASASATGGRYADLASIGGTLPPRLRTQLGAGWSFEQNGAVAVSWISEKDSGIGATQLLNTSYTVSFNEGWYFSATGLHDCSNGAWSAELALSIPVGHDLVGTLSAQTGGNTNEAFAGITRPTDPDGGFGYNLSASAGDVRGESGEATWNTDRGTLDGAVSSVNGQTAARLSASGAVVEMDGAVFATRNPDGALALVETGSPNVPVYLENRPVAVSDSDGQALLTNLTANSLNRVSIDPTDYSFATVFSATQKTVVPQHQSGVVVDLAPPRSRPALVELRFEDGSPVPVGGQVTLSDGGSQLPVGNGGQVFIVDLESRITGDVAYPAGSCHFTVAPPPDSSDTMIPRIGPVRCQRAPS